MIEIRTMTAGEVELVDRYLPLHRLEQPGGEWLVAWDADVPVGHAHLDWRVEPPQLQGVFVAEDHRRRGIATKLSVAAEQLAASRGFSAIALDVDVENGGARDLYEKLGYRPKGDPPRHVHGEILLRGEPFTFDAMLLDMVKSLE